jgi:transposase
MFIRRKKNKSGSASIMVIDKKGGRYQVKKSFGSSRDANELAMLVVEAEEYIKKISGQGVLEFNHDQDSQFLTDLQKGFRRIRVIGPELILGRLFEEVGYYQIKEQLFRHLVITRLVYPGSKLKTVEYLWQYKGVLTDENRIYRYMDQLQEKQKQQVNDITFEHTRQILGDSISVAFYDITTLYFEASQEDELRRLGFSKDGRAQNPQILLALLVGTHGYPLAYEIFPGNTFEGYTMLPVIEAFRKKYALQKLVVIADAGLLSKENIEQLKQHEYHFILGARLKNEESAIKEKMLSQSFINVKTVALIHNDETRLIVNYSQKRAAKDEHSRQRGLNRLEKSLKSGRLTKEHINDRGYNKYLKLQGNITVAIDYEAFHKDAKWNGLKGYVTNCDLTEQEVMDNYKQLWTIEKAFRISKTDLRIRPVYHRLEGRIRAHICLAFCSYKIYKELERQLKEKGIGISTAQAINLMKTIYEAEVLLPQSKKKTTVILPVNPEQARLLSGFGIKI